jgi:hypothetical protein
VNWPLLTAVDRDARWIELRRRTEDPSTNVLKPAGFSGGAAWLDQDTFSGTQACPTTPEAHCSLDVAVAQLKAAGFAVSDSTLDDLLLTSQLTGPIQLRAVPGHAESNMLNAAAELSCASPVCIDWSLLGRTWRGVVLTWVLLSLGAPFWYDALKDLLKLRSSMAQKDEQARASR